MTQRIQVRRGTAAAATTANPVLAAGEFGFETDTGKIKIGDGVTAWNSLAYFGAAADLTAHLADTSDAHDASAISFAPTGGLAATDVQAAITELDTEKAATTHVGVAGAGAAGYHTAGASIPNNTVTTIALGGEDFDTNGFHDNVTNPSRLTVPAGLGGKYDVFPQVSFGYNTSGGRAVILMKNGVEILNLGWDPTISSMGLASTAVALAAGDYLELATWQNSGAAMTLNNTTTRLTILRLGD